MTTAENVGKAYMLSEVEKQIRKDIPRLMELREGCILMKKNTQYNPVYRKIVFVEKDVYYIPSQCFGIKIIGFSKQSINKEYEIIGHDIMLNDVLEWLSKLNIIFDFRNDGEFWQIHRQDGYIKTIPKEFNMEGNPTEFETFPCKKDVPRLKFKWNLSSPYLNIDQSEELIKFLYNLIK